MLRRIEQRQRIINAAILVTVFVNALVLAGVSTKFFDTTVSIATNLVSSAIVGVVMWLSRPKS